MQTLLAEACKNTTQRFQNSLWSIDTIKRHLRLDVLDAIRQGIKDGLIQHGQVATHQTKDRLWAIAILYYPDNEVKTATLEFTFYGEEPRGPRDVAVH